eukprot:4145051-Pleurochrysis_carterae.AAC.2
MKYWGANNIGRPSHQGEASARLEGGKIVFKGTYIPTDPTWARARALFSQSAHDVGQRHASSGFSPAHLLRGTSKDVPRRGESGGGSLEADGWISRDRKRFGEVR